MWLFLTVLCFLHFKERIFDALFPARTLFFYYYIFIVFFHLQATAHLTSSETIQINGECMLINRLSKFNYDIFANNCDFL